VIWLPYQQPRGRLGSSLRSTGKTAIDWLGTTVLDSEEIMNSKAVY